MDLQEDFAIVASADSCTAKVNDIFPSKEIKIYNGDKEWMNSELRALRRQKSREYYRNKKSSKFMEMQKRYTEMKEANTKEYIENEVEALKSLNLRKFFTKIKEVGARLGENDKSSFSLSSHVEQNLGPEAAAEKIADHFSAISQEYPPLDTESLPDRVKEKIFHPDVSSHCPVIEEFEVYEKFKKRGFKPSSVPGDIPAKLKSEFSPELAGPAANIFNSITRSGTYPRQWVTEFVTPIPKVTPPENEDDLRNISLTADLSKDYKNFLSEWLMPFIFSLHDHTP